jgi:Calx-beta domain
MKRFWKREPDGFDLEAELRASRPEPGREFVETLAARVLHERPRSRRGSTRIAFAAGLSGLILVALASVGGLGYAAAGATKAFEAAKDTVNPSGPGTAGHTPSHTQYGKRCGNPHEEKPRKIKQPPCPVQAGNAKATEGNSGTTSMTFPVTIGGGYTPDVPITVAYLTRDGTAVAGSDYIATSGTLTFAAGETAKSVTVQIIGDTVRERDETFSLILVNPSAGAEIVDDEGVGTIVNDDKK